MIPIAMIAGLPLLFRVIPQMLPPAFLEPYNYWSAESLNVRPGETTASTKWRNMGWWQDTDVFPDANEALARKLIDLADAPAGGSVLDIAHGSGESLLLHLSSNPPPSHLYALTSLESETADAKHLVATRYPDTNTTVEFFTMSAAYHPGKDLTHPLNPMRNHLGHSAPATEDGEQRVFIAESETAGPPPYDLIYILDGVYHFPPFLSHFLTTCRQVLKPGGIIAYTDILPPPDLGPVLGHLVLPTLLSVPARNLVSRPKNLTDYQNTLSKLGYEDIVIEDWSEGVWKGFSQNLVARGGWWARIGNVVERAEKTGWKFIGVRAKKGEKQDTAKM